MGKQYWKQMHMGQRLTLTIKKKLTKYSWGIALLIYQDVNPEHKDWMPWSKWGQPIKIQKWNETEWKSTRGKGWIFKDLYTQETTFIICSIVTSARYAKHSR